MTLPVVKMFLLTTILTVIFSSVLIILAQNSCSLDLSTTQLIVLDKNNKIRLPITGETNINFTYQEVLYITCPSGSINPFLSDDGEKVQCYNGTRLYLVKNTRDILFQYIKCVQKLPTTVKVTDTKCQNVGTHIQIGLEILNTFANIYTVCFDQVNLVALNATFNVPYGQWGAFSDETTNHYFIDDAHLFQDNSVDTGIDLDSLYDNQVQIFANLGVPEYITDEVYLIKGVLLPTYLFSYSLEKQAAFNYVNVVPQWSTLERVFDAFIHNFISEHTLEPSVYEIGTLGVATLKNSNNQSVKLSLRYRQVPVPKWLWFSQPDSFTIYGYNNPYYEESEVEDEFKKICQLPISFEKFKNMLVGVCAGDPNVTSVY